MSYTIDISKEDIINVLDVLLKDRTTKHNIVWATDDYQQLGLLYHAECEINKKQVIGENVNVIQPRITKSQQERSNRTREKAEVFTPTWICNAQNNLIDTQWFNREGVFNTQIEKSWVVNSNKIKFPDKKGRKWGDYVDAPRLEITCGEAPYLVSRYDSVDGKLIQVPKRIGLLDRKMRVVNENTDNEAEWFKWVLRAYQATYGFEYQGDSLLIARKNLLYTFIENLKYKFNRKPTLNELKEITTVISWNIWQMDGLTYTSPYSDKKTPQEFEQIAFEETETQTVMKYCLIKDWKAARKKKKAIIEYRSLLHT